jgi:hypothetical protein
MSHVSKSDRKRAQDRIAQRSARQRTRERLASLELQVSQLQDGADKSLSSELQRMRRERDDLRVLSSQLLAVANAVQSTLDSGDNQRAPAPPVDDHDAAASSLMSRIFHDYEALKTVGPAMALPLSDAHVILNGILNGWDGPVADDEAAIHRLMAFLHRRFMSERPSARLIDQLAVLYLFQMSLLVCRPSCYSLPANVPSFCSPRSRAVTAI